MKWAGTRIRPFRKVGRPWWEKMKLWEQRIGGLEVERIEFKDQ